MIDKGRSVDSPTSLLAENEVLIFPLSFAQQRFWILDRLEPNSAVYNIPISLRFCGPLNHSALEHALSDVLRRHEVLRVTFELSNGSPIQVVHPPAPVCVPVRDLSYLPAEEREAEARRLALEEAQSAFDLSRGPLLRASLMKLSGEDHILLVTVHHIVFDGWSGRVFIRELMSGYTAITSGQNPGLPDLALQYTDYIIWQRDHLSGERLQEHLGYWRDKLAGAPGALDLATDFPRPARQSFRGAKLATTLSSSLVRSLKQLSQREGATLFMTLLAGFNVLLARHTGQEDIVVGSPIAGRSRVELENLIGLFINTLALRTDTSGNPSFRQLLRQVRDTTLGAYAHEDLPFEKIVDELKPERDLSRNPVFQVMFSLQSLPKQKSEVPGLNVTPFVIGAKPTSKFDLSVTLFESNDEIRASWEYCSDLFRPDTIARLQQHFVNLLEGIATNPDSRISDLPLLTQDERQELTNFNHTGAHFRNDLCLHNFFEQQAEKTPSATALICGATRISYQELNRRANQLAHFLRAQGAGPEIPIAICLERGLNMLVAVFGILKAGAGYVPLDPTYPNQRLDYILEDSRPALVLTQRSLLAKVGREGLRTVCLEDDWNEIASYSDHNPAPNTGPENLAYLLFTSGSTGRPKGVALEHRNASNFVQWAQSTYSPAELALTLFSTSLCFDLSVFEIFVPLSVGAAVVLSENAIRLNESPVANQITLINTVPSAMAELVRSGLLPQSVQTVNLCGEALPGLLAQQLCSLGHIGKVYNLYGPTEATTYSTVALMAKGVDVNIGRPIANTQVYLLDNNLQQVPVGAPGYLYLGGEGLARGYWNRPDLTRERFVDNPIAPEISPRLYHTGDLARFSSDGTLHFIGRNDSQVKFRGYRIELAEIEKGLERHPAVQQSVVVMRNSGSEAQLAAYVVARRGMAVTTDGLKAHLASLLPSYMVPASIMQLERLPLTSNGKVNRLALPQPERSYRATNIPPRNNTESTLLAAWQRVLGIADIGVTDNFFELGGHSLLAVRLMAEIQRDTGEEIPLATLFQGATIEHLAKVVREAHKTEHEMVIAVQPEGSKSPFFGIVVPGTNSLGYLALARHLGNDQPFYRVQGPGERLRRPYSAQEFEGLAANYIAAIKKIQPRGPYYLGGMCEGARIAFDMARLLDAEGERVGVLAIFDTWVLENSQNRFLWKIDYLKTRLKRLWKDSPKAKWQAIEQWAKHKYGSSRPELLWPKAYWPGKDFVPAKYSGKITLFKIRRQPFFYVNDPLMGWGTRTTGEVEVHLIKSKHLAMLREPYVQELASKLRECLHVAQHEPAETLQERSPVLVREVVLPRTEESIETLAVSSDNEIFER